MTVKRILGLAMTAAGVGLLLGVLAGAVSEQAETGLIMLAIVLAVVGLETGGFGFFTKRGGKGGRPPPDGPSDTP